MPKKTKAAKKAWVLGLGFDNADGHTRITSGENFQLLGGSEETHSTMTEKAVKMNEQLKRRGKTLNSVSREEFHEIAHEIGMRLLTDRPHGRKTKH
jgi:seryl-tRNA(Sec) selenium transferase